jgi:hypothetical protein
VGTIKERMFALLDSKVSCVEGAPVSNSGEWCLPLDY